MGDVSEKLLLIKLNILFDWERLNMAGREIGDIFAQNTDLIHIFHFTINYKF